MESLTTMIVAFLACIVAVNGLSCYNCSSEQVGGCGVTFNLDNKEDYEVQCPENATACVKTVSELPGHGKNMVSRRCWMLNNAEGYTPNGCTKFASKAKVCYCLNNDKPCNGQSPIQAAIYAIFGLVFLPFFV